MFQGLPAAPLLPAAHVTWREGQLSVTSPPPPTALYSEGGTVRQAPPCLLCGSKRDEMARKSTPMRSWRMGSREIADSVSPLLCTKATFHSPGKIHRGPSGRNGLPQDSCLLSSRPGGQDWLTQMPPFLRHTDLKLAEWRNASLCEGGPQGRSVEFSCGILTATTPAVAYSCLGVGTF